MHTRKFAQFSLRALLSGMATVTILLGLWTQGALHQAEAVRVLRDFGVTVRYGADAEPPVVEESVGAIILGSVHPTGNSTLGALRSSLAVAPLRDLWDAPVALVIPAHSGRAAQTNAHIDQRILAAVRQLNRLKSLTVRAANLDTDWLCYLTTCRQLETIRLVECNLPRPAAPMISRCALFAKTIDLSGSRGIANVLRIVAGCSELEMLILQDTDAGNSSIGYFNGLAKLEYLDLSHTEVTDSGIGRIAVMAQLRYLSLRGCRIADRHLSHLCRLPSLEALWIADTGVSDAGLDTLARCWKLRELVVTRAMTTERGIGRFCSARPSCAVVR